MRGRDSSDKGVEMFVPGQEYVRREIHDQYGGQQQGGISTPAKHDFIMLFTGEQGEQYGYLDSWTTEGRFLYTGEGQVGDMSFVRGNRAVRDHQGDGKALHLFEYSQQRIVRYVGEMLCTGYRIREGPDAEGNLRNAIVFELQPIGEVAQGAACGYARAD